MKKKSQQRASPLQAVKQGKKKLFSQNVGALLFIFFCSLLYTHAVNKKKGIIHSLKQQQVQLQHERSSLRQKNEELLLQIDSQNDPAWLELVLKRGLGLVPEGQVKVYFHEGCDSL